MQIAEERHCEGELQVADALPYFRAAVVVLNQRHRVESLLSVDRRTWVVRTCNRSVDVCCPTVESVAVRVLHRKSRVETD